MKNLLITLMLFIGINCIAQTDTSKNQLEAVKTTLLENIPDTTSITFKEVYKDFKEGIEGIASSLKVGAEHVYTIIVAQVKIEAICDLVILIITTCLFIYFLSSILKIKNWKCNTYYEIDWRNIGGKEAWEKTQITPLNIIYIIVTIVLLAINLTSLNNLSYYITAIFNPEYAAIEKIMNFIK